MYVCTHDISHPKAKIVDALLLLFLVLFLNAEVITVVLIITVE